MIPWTIFYLVLCSISIGLDKGGLPGVAALGMALALSTPSFDSSISTGRILALFVPVLSLADLGAVYKYSKTIQWNIIKQLILPILLGLLIGFYFIGSLNDHLIRILAGYALLLLSIFHFLLPHLTISLHQTLPKFSSTKIFHRKWFTPNQAWFYGLFIGYFTIISNIAGPIAVTYLLQIDYLNKNEINGTRSCLFLLINCIKIPIQIYLKNLQLYDGIFIFHLCVIAVLVTFLTASYLMPVIQQRNFETITWLLVIASAVKLILQW